jgi:pimeloyl-ACP methyl ester carboxylesterase
MTTTTANRHEQPTGFGSVTGVPDLPAGFIDRFQSQYVTVDGVRLHAVTGGSGHPVVLVGGWPEFWWQWRALMPELANNRSVIAVDPRGMGLSDRPKNGYDTGTVAAEIVQLAEQLGHDSFDLVGHDVGAWISYALASDFPDRVSTLTLVDAALPGISAAPSAMPCTQREAAAAFHFTFNRLDGLNEHLVSGREDIFIADQFATKGATPQSIPPHVVDVYVRVQRLPDALRGYFSYYRALDDTIVQNERRAQTQLQMPVLAVGGKRSRGPVLEKDVSRVATDVRAVVVPDCGHYVPEEAPEALLAAIRSLYDDGPGTPDGSSADRSSSQRSTTRK